MKLRKSPSLLVLLGTLVIAGSAPAASLLLDFGAGAPSGAASGADGLTSPGHQSGGISSSENTWNYIDSDSKTNLVFGDGTASTISIITRGEVSNNTNILNFTTGRGINTVGVEGNGAGVGSVYGGNAPARNGVFVLNTNNTANAAIGSKITGLAAGTYTIYVTGRNTNNNASSLPGIFYLSTASSTLDTFQFSGLNNTTEASVNVTHTAASMASATHVEGVTYAGFYNITLGENESIFLATEGTGSDPRGFINSIEIVAVPEPSAIALLGGGLSLLAFRRRRA